MDVEPHCDVAEKTEAPEASTSADSPRGDEPLQLIEFIRNDNDGNTTIKLIDATMKILAEKAGSRPLSIVCICGQSRQGKSFMLGHMIRCLKALEQEDTDWMDWENKNKALEGFKFRNGTKPETQGIWVWSRPFIVKNDEEKEVAVLLIDTQGTCDEFTTAKDMSAIVGISLLISSVMIFNCFTNLQEDILSSMKTYTHYGQLALEQVEGHPFQKLIFLIRDWNNPGEFTYGSKGGKIFLKEKLKLKPDQPTESQQVRKTIQDCFEDLDCFLMPNIGDKALYPGFTGSVGELAPPFAKKMEEFISSLLSNETLVIKKILGNVVTLPELEVYLNTYLEVFNSSEIPSASQMLEANTVVHNNNIVKRSLQKFIDIVKKKLRGNSYLPEEDLEKAAKAGEKQATEMFKKGRKLGSPEKIVEYEEKLEKDIKREKSEFKKLNEEKRNKYISAAMSDATIQYRELLEDSISFEDDDPTFFYEEEVVNRSAKQAKDTAIEDFKQKIEIESEEKIMVSVQSLEEIMESSFTFLMNKNKLQRSNAEKLMTTMVVEHTGEFTKTVEVFLEENKFADCQELKTAQEEAVVSTVESFKKAKKPGKKEFHKGFQEKLEKELKDTSVNMENKHKLFLQQCKTNAENSVQSTCEEYEKQLREKAANVELEEELKIISDEIVANLMEDFLKNGNPYPEEHVLHGQLREKLIIQLEGIYEMVKREVIISQEQMEQSYRNAVEMSVTYYVDEMKEIVGSGDCIAVEDLEHEDKKLRIEAEEKYEDFEKVGVPENALDFKAELEDRLEEEFQSMRAKNEQNWELAHSKAKNFVKDSHRRYQESMKPAKDTVRNVEDLEALHLKAFQEAREYFAEKCPAKDDPDFVAQYQQDLEVEIEDTYEELKDLFEMKRQEEDVATKPILVDCRKYYHDEMGKHCKNVSFIRPEHLESMHEQAKGAVITRCAKNTPLSDFQKLDLESEMDKLFFSKYESENDMKLNSIRGVAPAIGIDLGTTYCCVAVYYNGKVDIIPNQEQGNTETTASYVAYNSDGSITIGDAAKHNAYKNPESTIYDAKRIIGRKINDPELQKDMKMWPFDVEEDEGIPKIKINGKYYFPEQVSAELLSAFKAMAEKRYKMTPGTITKAVITVPAYFNDGQRQATIDAGELAGFDEVIILNEPTAAAMAYSMERLDASPRKVLIFDLGGGTFDVAVLDVEPKNIEVLGVSGDTHLGGEDFDQYLMEHCALVFQAETGVDLMNGKDSSNKTERYDARRRLRRLQTECEKAKKMLTSGTTATVSLDAIHGGTDLSVQVTREKFEQLNEALFKKTIDIVDKALRDACGGRGVKKEEIEDIVLVGGSTRIPKVKDLLTEYFEEKALNVSIPADTAVAYGAAVHAALWNGEQAKGQIDFNKIQDVTPLSLGVAVYDKSEPSVKKLSIIVPKNTQIPVKSKQDYRTSKDNQPTCLVEIYEGEDYIAANNNLLGTFILDGIPLGIAGKERIDVTMEVDSMGILHVEAVILSTKGRNKITVTENKLRMSTETKKRLLAEANPAA